MGRRQRKIEREEREVVYAARSKVVFETRGGNKIAGSEDAARLALVLSELFLFSPSLSPILVFLSRSSLVRFFPPFIFIFTRSDYPGEKCREKGGERGKKNRVALALFAHRTSYSSERYTGMVHMDLEMFASRAVQILIKRNIFRMRAPTGAGETNRRVPFLISCRRARKNAADNSASMTFSRFHVLPGAFLISFLLVIIALSCNFSV